MSVPMPYTWVCSACGRNVPIRVSHCHCGAARETSEASSVPAEETPSLEALTVTPGWQSIWRTLPGDVRAMVLCATVLVLGGVAWLVASPPHGDSGPALLGRVERPPSRPSPPPAFKLPWWK